MKISSLHLPYSFTPVSSSSYFSLHLHQNSCSVFLQDVSPDLKLFMCSVTLPDLCAEVISIPSVVAHEFLPCTEEPQVVKSVSFRLHYLTPHYCVVHIIILLSEWKHEFLEIQNLNEDLFFSNPFKEFFLSRVVSWVPHIWGALLHHSQAQPGNTVFEICFSLKWMLYSRHSYFCIILFAFAECISVASVIFIVLQDLPVVNMQTVAGLKTLSFPNQWANTTACFLL